MLWVKAFHIISMMAWFTGLFYLPRLFVYHAMAEDQKTQDHLKIMERKLYGFIQPFMVLTFILGIVLLSANAQYYLSASWFQIKIACVLCLLGFHIYLGWLVKVFAKDANQRNDKFYRIINEIPTLFLFIIVIMIVVRPFQ